MPAIEARNAPNLTCWLLDNKVSNLLGLRIIFDKDMTSDKLAWRPHPYTNFIIKALKKNDLSITLTIDESERVGDILATSIWDTPVCEGTNDALHSKHPWVREEGYCVSWPQSDVPVHPQEPYKNKQ